MAILLHIETATKNCSVSISKNGACLYCKEESADKFVHAEKLHLFIQECLEKTGMAFADLEGVAVSNGPGSYTGLRIGISAAKGFCYALNIPLISLPTNQVLANGVANPEQYDFIITALDARRNEIYAAVFDSEKNALTHTTALILEQDSFDALKAKTICVVGDAAKKTADLVTFNQVEVFQEFPSAKNMCALAEEKFLAKEFVDVAYHEPFYLKEFVAGKPKKLL